MLIVEIINAFRAKFHYIIFAVVMLVPTIYSYFYLAAYFDPYGKTDKMPIAIVNEDNGYGPYNFGKNITSNLIAQHAFDFSEQSAADAQDGLDDRTYLATIRFPATFTSNIMTAVSSPDGKLTPSVIDFRPNMKTSFLASTIITSGLQSLEQQARASAVLTVVNQLLNVITEVQKDTDLNITIGSLLYINQSSYNYQSEVAGYITKLNQLTNKLAEVTMKCGGQCSYDAIKDELEDLATLSNDINNDQTTFEPDVTNILNVVSNVATHLQGLSLPKTETLEALPDFASAPVEMVETDVGKIDYYGLSFVPMFTAVGCWLGCLMSMLTFYYDPWHRFGILDSTHTSFLQVFAFLGLAACFGLIDGACLLLNLWFKPTNVFFYFFSCMLIGVSFMCIVLFLVVLMGDVGKFIVLVLLVFQLGAAGPTFPIQVVAPGLKWLHPVLPMTHAIRLMREAVVSRTSNMAASAIGILFAFAGVSLFFTSLYIFIVQRLEKKEQAKKGNAQ